MAYTVTDYKSKKALRKALGKGERIEVYQPGPFGPNVREDGSRVALEGPHYPRPHTWYASCIVRDGCIVPGSLK